MKIVKMHGLGNDFIIIDGRETPGADWSQTAKRLCARRVNIGADGLAIIEDSSIADIKMRIINANGSEAEMCGNAIRCFAKYMYERGIVQKEELSVETIAGVMRPRLIIKDGKVEAVRVDMGEPCFERPGIPMAGEGEPFNQKISVCGQDVTVSSVLMGVPHTMVLCDDIYGIDFEKLGPAIEKCKWYPQNTNVNFTQIIDKHTIKIRTWERGAGATMACGTGSCGVVAILNKLGLAEPRTEVVLSAGSLIIEVENGRVFMTGPAQAVFEGETL